MAEKMSAETYPMVPNLGFKNLQGDGDTEGSKAPYG